MWRGIGLLLAAGIVLVTPTVADQSAVSEFRMSDAPLRKTWGPVKGAYYDPKFGGILVLEDTTGTVRLVGVQPGGETRVLSVITRSAN